MTRWTHDGIEITNERGLKIASAAYARTRGCSMKVGEAEKRRNLDLMTAAPELHELVHDLWDFIENCTDEDPERTDKFFKLRERVRERWVSLAR